MVALRFIFILFFALALSSCKTNSEWQSGSITLDRTDQALFQSWQKLNMQFNCCAADVWDSTYRPQNEPILFARTRRGRFQHGYIINHPNPTAIAGAVRIYIPALQNLPPIYRIDSLSPAIFERIGNFDFELAIGGSDVFAASYQKRSAEKSREPSERGFEYQEPGEISFADVASDDWVLFLAHEIFHRRQFKQWVQLENNQDLDSYIFSQENIALILLEQEILKNGIRGRTKITAQQALIEYTAVRDYREQLFGRQITTLDSAQEIYEGTSRYIEHRLGELIRSKDFNMSNLDEQIESDTDILLGINIRDTLGFGRFYASGAAVSTLMDRANIEWKESIKTAPSFAQIVRNDFVIENEDSIIRSAQIRYGYPALFARAGQYVRRLNN